MNAPHQILRLPSGQELAWSLHGPGPRKAVFFHGHPGSRHQASFLEPHLAKAGLEVLAFDRPGYGNSSPETESARPIDLAAQVEALAEAAGFRRFHLIAVSGGAPYALSAAAAVGERVQGAAIVCGLGPLADSECRPHFPRSLLAVMKLALKVPEPLLEGVVRFQLGRLLRQLDSAGGGEGKAGRRPPFLSEADFELVGSEAVRPRLRASLEAAFRQGVQGSRRDLRAFLAPWEVDWRAISCPVALHHGLDDRLVPWRFSEILGARLPNARFVPYEGEGHYTLPIRRAAEILRGLPG